MGTEAGEPGPVITSNPDEVGEAITMARAEFAKVKGDHEYIVTRLRQDVEDFRADLGTARASLETAAAEVASLKAQLVTSENAAEEKARNILRKSGHAPIATTATADPAATPSNYNTYKEMSPGAERLKFFNSHRAEIERADKAAQTA